MPQKLTKISSNSRYRDKKCPCTIKLKQLWLPWIKWNVKINKKCRLWHCYDYAKLLGSSPPFTIPRILIMHIWHRLLLERTLYSPRSLHSAVWSRLYKRVINSICYNCILVFIVLPSSSVTGITFKSAHNASKILFFLPHWAL